MKNYCFLYFKTVYKYRHSLITLILNELKVKYSTTLLGYIWLFLYPTIFLVLYAIVYLFIFKVRISHMTSYEYVLMIFSALIPFLTLSDSISRGLNLVLANANIVKMTNFPIELLGLQIVITAQIIQVVGFSELLIVLFFTGKLTAKIFILPFIWFFQILFSLGLVYLLAALNVFYRDLSNIVPLLIILLMMISPIAYTENMVPESLRFFLYLNPLYYLLNTYQQIFLINKKLNIFYLNIFAIISLVTFCLGLYIFYRLKPIFRDYI